MEKYTALLIPVYLGGFVLAVLLLPLFTLSSEYWVLFNASLDAGLPLFVIGGAITGIIAILLARGISYLFLDQSQ